METAVAGRRFPGTDHPAAGLRTAFADRRLRPIAPALAHLTKTPDARRNGRTPLNAIIGYSDVLCCQMFGPLGSPRNLEYVNDIRDSGRKLLGAVNDLIEIARIEAGDTGTVQGSFEASAAVQQAVLSMGPAADGRNVSIAVATYDEQSGSLINLCQALERVLDNAIRYSNPGGTIDISIQRIDDVVEIAVADHGEGIALDRLADLVRPFGLPENHLVTYANKAMGFGIPIARGLVQLMGGTFAIDSEPGSGTTVCIRLPAQTEKSGPGETLERGPVPGVIWTSVGRDHVARRIAGNR
jgi:two-component system cell cycle sensor histidine kinase PleC